MKTISAKEFDENPILSKMVEPENDLKNMLVEYVGENHSSTDNEVTVEMIVETMAKEFPEFILAVAEENWIRGYQQAIHDVSNSEQYMPSPVDDGDALKVTFSDDEEDDDVPDDVECGA